MINITLLGCGGSMPSPNRYLSSAIINYNGSKILIDCGEGTQVAMRKFNIGFKQIDTILLTHFHGDHILGLPGLLQTMGNCYRTEPVTIIGPLGLNLLFKNLKILFPYLPFQINLIETLTPLNYTFKNITINSIELDHSCPCNGYKFYLHRSAKFDVDKAKFNNVPQCLWNTLQKGKNVSLNNITYTPNMVLGNFREGIKISYIVDSRPNEDISNFICNSNLLICEGTYSDDMDLPLAIENKHMTFSESANLAKNSKCKEMWLTHFSPKILNPIDYKETCTKIFENSYIGFDGLNKELNFK